MNWEYLSHTGKKVDYPHSPHIEGVVK